MDLQEKIVHYQEIMTTLKNVHLGFLAEMTSQEEKESCHYRVISAKLKTVETLERYFEKTFLRDIKSNV